MTLGPASTKIMTVAVVEDHPVYRRGLVGALSAANDLRVAISCASLEELISDLGEQHVDVVLLDLGLPGIQGTEGVSILSARGLPTLVLSARGSSTTVAAAFAAGAHGYLSKIADVEDIIAAIRSVGAGQIVGGDLVSPPDATERTQLQTFTLSAREREVLTILAVGSTDRMIARDLHISVSTVRSHLDTIRRKTGHRRRVHLARLALAEGLVPSVPDTGQGSTEAVGWGGFSRSHEPDPGR
jgi:DNA-binding NarL/FixJ family response regulator